VLRYAFKTLSMIRINGPHLTRNPASGRALIKLGLQHEESRRKFVPKYDKYENGEFYRILREEWEAIRIL